MADAAEVDGEEEEEVVEFEEGCPECKKCPSWRTSLDGNLCRHGHTPDGVLRSDSVFRRVQRTEIQTDFRIAEKRLWCAACGADCRTAQGNDNPVAELQPITKPVDLDGYDAADNKHSAA